MSAPVACFYVENGKIGYIANVEGYDSMISIFIQMAQHLRERIEAYGDAAEGLDVVLDGTMDVPFEPTEAAAKARIGITASTRSNNAARTFHTGGDA